jgi:hypothetical protein
VVTLLSNLTDLVFAVRVSSRVGLGAAAVIYIATVLITIHRTNQHLWSQRKTGEVALGDEPESMNFSAGSLLYGYMFGNSLFTLVFSWFMVSWTVFLFTYPPSWYVVYVCVCEFECRR